MKKFQYILIAVLVPTLALAATTAKKQSAIQNGTTVRNKTVATGLYDAECYDAYYGCMDQFCISENANGGSCLCSNDNEKYEAELEEINAMVAEAERIQTVEVEKIQAGANVDIIFGGGRKYDEKGNIVYANQKIKENPKTNREDLMKLFEVNLDFDDEENDDDIMSKTGAALFNAADATCKAIVDTKCDKDLKLLRQMYLRQIDSDCRGFANSIAQQRAAAQSAMNSAESDVRNAYRESFAAANKYNLGECMVEFKKCMTGADACGTDWVNCVSTIASENMQNKSVKDSYAGDKVATTVTYGITASVMERLNSKRTICERVLDSCMAVRDEVWPAFLREAAPTLKLAELRAESNMRQSCLTNITNCLHTACRDDIASKGVATMDACLSRPTMARDFCKVQIEPCERMAGDNLWSYVTDKLLAMRVDACTTEVKECLMDEIRCGPDFMNCIGMDYEFVRGLCHVDKLPVCKAYHKDNDSELKMDDIDNIITGLYLNIDNKALENCQKLVEDKMTEICGSTTDCNRFASDDTIGTGSLRSQKDGNVYRITGMISFGSLKVGTGNAAAGLIDITEYMANIAENNEKNKIANYDGIVSSIRQELSDVAGNINNVIKMIESDPQIQYCVSGRSLEQITGEENKSTVARFPNLLNQVKMQIAIAALRQAQNNYQAKYNEYLTKATKDASADIAQYMCQMLPTTGGTPVGSKGIVDEQTSLASPYAISYEIGAGLNNNLLTQGAGHTASSSKGSITRGKKTVEFPGGSREMWATFNRDTRICRLCTSTITRDCNAYIRTGFWGIGAKSETDCTESDPIEKCDDIEM